jgi:outer membrane lipoprotein-sorting protein/peroxiredoxin
MKSLMKSLLVAGCLLCGGADVRADKAGDALLEKCVDAEAKLKSLQATFTLRQETGAQTRVQHGTIKLQKPNRALITLEGSQASDSRTLASDGRQFTIYYSADNEFQREAADPSGGNVGRIASTEVTVFFNADVMNQIRSQGTGIKIAGTLTIGGISCKELRVTGSAPNAVYKLYVGSDMLLHGVTLAYDTPMGRSATESRLTDVKTNPPLPPATFAFALPKGAKPYQEGVADTRPSSGTDPQDSGLLPIGTIAPDFQLPQPEGGKLTFSTVTKAHKATLLCFWNNSFAPCREELPDLNKMLADYKDRGFEIVTVNSGDDVKVIRKLWQDASLTLRAVMSGDKVADKYHVTAVPTNYLVGGNGKILARFEGFDETAIRAALPKAGVK